MTWNTPTNRSVGELITPAIWNDQIVTNLLYLKVPVVTITSPSTFDTTSTIFVPIVETQNIVTTTGARVLLLANGWFQHLETGTAVASVGIIIDGSLDPYGGGSAVDGFVSGTTDRVPWSIAYVSNTLSAAMHTFRLYGKKADGGGTQGAVRFTVRTFVLIEL